MVCSNALERSSSCSFLCDIAEPVAGQSTVIAQLDDDRYAFFRGTTDLLPHTGKKSPPAQSTPQLKTEGGKQAGKGYLLDQLRQDNEVNSMRQQELLRNNYYNHPNRGVKANAAY